MSEFSKYKSKPDYHYSILEKFVAFEFLFISGSIYLSLSPFKAVFMMIWVITTFYLYKIKKTCCDTKNIILLCLISTWGLINEFVIHTSVGPYPIFELICLATGSLFVISSMEFHRLRNLLLSELAILSIISIVVALLYQFGIIGSVETITNRNVALIIFSVTSREEFRLESVYWEAGQFQIVLFYIFFLFTDKLRTLVDFLKDIRFVIIMIAILLTKSTTGYIVLMLFFISLIMSGGTKTYIKVLLMPLGLLILNLLLYSSVIQDKFQDDNVSFQTRAIDQQVSIEFIREDPFYGKGLSTVEYEKAVNSLLVYTASNGWLTAMVRFGIPLGMMLIIVMICNIRRMKPGINFVMLSVLLIISQCNEWYIFFPVNYLYFYRVSSNGFVIKQ